MAWFDKIKDAIKDTTTLDVVTASGSIQLTAADMGDDGWENIAEKVSAKVKAANVNIVAFTHTQWDCDTFMFVKENLSESEQALVESHAAVVDASHATRRAAVKLLHGIIGSAVD